MLELFGFIQKRQAYWYCQTDNSRPRKPRGLERIRNSASHLLHAEMELQTDVDPSIEGGFVFDINDFRLDASIATQLKRVKQQFIDKNRRIV